MLPIEDLRGTQEQAPPIVPPVLSGSTHPVQS